MSCIKLFLFTAVQEKSKVQLLPVTCTKACRQTSLHRHHCPFSCNGLSRLLKTSLTELLCVLTNKKGQLEVKCMSNIHATRPCLQIN